MTDLSTLTLGLAISVAVVLILKGLLSPANENPPLPPGPKGLPLAGNLNDLPKPGVLEAHHWLKHKDLYGPISSVTVMGQTLVIINDAQLAFELLEKRSVNHSSRPRQIFAGEMLGWENSLGLSQYNDRFRTYRKNMSRIIGSKTAAAQYNTLQEAEVGHFLLHVLDNPDDLVNQIRKEAGAVILKIAYGYTADPFKDDVLVSMAGDAMDKFARAGVPGAFIVDMMPFLRYLPDWVPGTGWKRTARQWAAELNDVTEKPYAFVKHQIAQGKDDNSFLSRLLEAGDSTPEEKFTNKWSAMSLYTAGADTTVSALACFFLAMSTSPDVQRKAQEEIDRVIGDDRLPTLADRPSLPYIDAIVKEVLRWHPVAPMGLPHTSTADDVCEGYFIPKGSMLFANVWHFTHDPEVYDEPMSFKPERFLPSEGKELVPDPHTFVFGFGRRICPGRILADNALYLNIAQSLAVFAITKDDQMVQPEIQFTPGVVSHPEPFKATIKPRSLHHGKLIRSIEQVYPWEESDAGILESMSS
ncbi:hypothetical protein CDV36_003782 [Fusarium kuroshium]|uniref:O-methylsterigmatocystin oxidoreductase n=1 Tax=Fusarium kuroshium TaxID=2010991 RepID=A0A3M2SH79_9HYPO|nr:hypothetical protein CDV36_003782 [Fusarium kuroshium]